MLLLLIISTAALVNSEGLRLLPSTVSETYTTATGSIRRIEKDLFIPGNILFTDDSALKTTDGQTTHIIAGNASSRAYQEGVGEMALFNHIPGFIQLSQNQVVLTDFFNHCLRSIDRQTRQSTTFVGECTRIGYRDGSNALFSLPRALVKDVRNPMQLILSDENNNALRIINTVTQSTGTLLKSDDLLKPHGMVQLTSGDIYLTTLARVFKYVYETGDLTPISGSSPGFRDGPFTQALYDYPHDIVFLSDDILLLADRDNHRVRELDLKTNMTSSICSGGGQSQREGDRLTCQLILPRALNVLDDKLYIGDLRLIRYFQGELITTTIATTTGTSTTTKHTTSTTTKPTTSTTTEASTSTTTKATTRTPVEEVTTSTRATLSTSQAVAPVTDLAGKTAIMLPTTHKPKGKLTTEVWIAVMVSIAVVVFIIIVIVIAVMKRSRDKRSSAQQNYQETAQRSMSQLSYHEYDYSSSVHEGPAGCYEAYMQPISTDDEHVYSKVAY